MFRLNKMTDYTVVVLSALACGYDQTDGAPTLTASEVADKAGVMHATTAKLLKRLATVGLVEASRGRDGGYRLAKAPHDIKVAHIIEAVEGPIALTACVETAQKPCCVRHRCFLSGNWDKVNQAITATLGQVSLADLCDPSSMFIVPAVPHATSSTPAGVDPQPLA